MTISSLAKLRVAAGITDAQPATVEVVVDRDIRPVGTGTWELPPLPHAEPNFPHLAGLV